MIRRRVRTDLQGSHLDGRAGAFTALKWNPMIILGYLLIYNQERWFAFSVIRRNNRSLGSSVGIATEYGLNDRGYIPETKKISLLCSVQTVYGTT
jgi:hypothetical protein